MYNPDLEALIDAALADGELTEKEKQILFKKAQTLGVDLDEFEMVLDARLVKQKKAEQEKSTTSAPKSNKLGDVKKCPACGAIVQSYQGVCPECGYAFEGTDANSAVKELSSLLQKVSDYDKMRKIIDNFPIPLEKTALLSFVTWLRPQSTDIKNPLSNSYYKKYVECVNKIKVSFSNDTELSPFVDYLTQDEQRIRNQKITKITLKNKWFWIVLAVLIILGFFLKPEPLDKNLFKTNVAMIEAVDNGDLAKAEQLLANYKGRYKPEDGAKALCNAFIQRGQLDKAELYMHTAGLEYDVFKAYLKNKEYEKADSFIGGIGLSDKIEEIIIAMCENGDKDKAKKYLESKKTIMKNSSERYYGKEEGLSKYKDRIEQINKIIQSY